MRKVMILLMVMFSLPFVKTYGEPEYPPYYNSQHVYTAGVEALVEETKHCTWSYVGSRYTWVKTTNPYASRVMVMLTCNNDIKDDYMKSHMAIAYPYSYQYSQDGYWTQPFVWVDEYINPSSFPPFDDWCFSASLCGYCAGHEIVVFECFNDTYYYV